MNNVHILKRLFSQLINYIIYYLISFGVFFALLYFSKINLPTYIVLSICLGFIIHIVLGSLITFLSKKISIGGLFFQIKVVSAEEKNPKFSQIFLRTFYEAILVFLIFDFLFLIIKKTSRSAIDRLSSTFLITILD